jgi:murein L,D-transpeptidase YcbB/YkuD
VIANFVKSAAFATLLASAVPAYAQTPAAPAAASGSLQLASLPAAATVARYYDSRRNELIWFKPGSNAEGPAQLSLILHRAQVEGLPLPADLGARVDAAIAAAKTSPAAAIEADRLLSTAWVSYVQALNAPMRDVLYGDNYVRPKVPSAELIMVRASIAPQLAAHLRGTADINPIYVALRDAAWAQAQLPGGGTSAQLAANLDRARGLPAKGRFVLVDSATQRLWMYEDGRVVDSMKVIVGMDEYKTPMIASMMYYATLNPYWHVPDHLVRKTLAPNVLKRGPAYLKANGYEIVSEWSNNSPVVSPSSVDWKAAAAGTVHVKIRQLPGATNSMGKMKFPFPNNEGIYLHDTPDKTKFTKTLRTLSNGCIRLEDAKRLGRWLLGREPTPEASGPEQYVQLPRAVPIYVTYLTAQPHLGEATPVKDVYGRDTLQAQAKTASVTAAAGS